MASIQEPEVQFAQRLASNEKPIRTKAIKKLRKYINVRSQKATGGFTGDELLKLWKGLFYCLWMQDKPLLQEELSNQISTLIHSFHDIDGQFGYLESFLQTFKREWTGIDRLRMDKFFQLVRFMFRQTFELLKRKNWESSVVARFLELLTVQLLQIGSGAPSGLQFHILDLYMTELAAVGSAELTADQNLIFIKPFCKTAAKTKDRSLFRAICNSILSTIIDQAPFAIEDLMKEVEAAAASDSGQASEVDNEEDHLKEKTTSKPLSKKGTGEQINGDDDDDELLHLEDSDTEVPCDDDIGPVLQFDYAALADNLFELASRSSTPSQNRQRLYKIIKVLRDLSEGIFPQDEYPEDVSTDEDDEMFGSRKRMRRGSGQIEEDEEGAPAGRKSKKKEASKLNKQNKDPGKDGNEPADLTAKKKRKKKKKKAGQGGSAGGEENAGRSEQEQTVAQARSSIEETEGGPEYSEAEDLEKEAQTQSSISLVKVTEAATPEGQSGTLLLSEVKKPLSVTVTEETSQPTPCTTDNRDQSERSSKKKTRETSEQQTHVRTEPEMSSEASAPVSGKKKKKGLKAKLQTDGQTVVAESPVNAEAEITPVSSEKSAEKNTTPETDATTPAKKKKKGLKAKNNLEGVESESQVLSTEADFPSIPCEDSVEDGPTIRIESIDSRKPVKKKSKKKNLKAHEAQKVVADAQLGVEGKCTDTEITSVGEEASQDTTAVPLKKKTKKKGKQEDTLEASPAADESAITPLKTKRKKNKKESKTTVEEEGAAAGTPHVADAEKLLFEITMTTPAKKKKTQKLAEPQVDKIKDQTQLQLFGSVDAELPLDETKVFSASGKSLKKNKRKIPVVFEFEADELEATSINGHAEETVAKKTKLGSGVEVPSTPLSTKKSQKKAKTSSGSASALLCKTKRSPCTPLSSKKKNQTPKSESKKVTFGLKNNKTAEFRKTDRSLLVSPDGSSRVPFDPKQKPKFGVLKSPPTPLCASVKKTPNGNRKTSSDTPKSTPKRRPSAADFF
ncbi:ribosomal RNA processing protein 1 homolog B-like isoform X2 [Siniperca chuatsi]|uniref:ribosomal RNA processing protein 1 homolog B-like isoform X2 n=1 Tax=Siniperca chuatsi TaxID=119488 RepID=UPI001CE0F3B5|nr:ribosomal RNA processing protein 1 homolog B-like isoform X2 [Siniperca chuatsi]